jgi:type IV secretion system protein VirB10
MEEGKGMSGGNSGEKLTSPGKKKPEEALRLGTRGRKKPPKLNKNFILISLVSFAAVFLILTQFVIPFLSSGKGPKEEVLEISRQDFTDYSRFAVPPVPEASSLPSPPPEKKRSDDEILSGLPPLSYYTTEENTDREMRPGEKEFQAPASRNVPSWPATIQDPLQGKIIKGIKGLTPTQGSYQENGGEKAAPSAPRPEREKSDYASRLLSRYGEALEAGNAASLSAGRTDYEKQNDQAGKKEFFEDGRLDTAGRGSWLPLNTVWMGTIFEALLLGDINTDLPGEAAAVVNKNIYSSQGGEYLLIPQGSRLIGNYNSSVSYGQSRVQVGWHTLIRPDGYELKLGNMSGTDSRGAAGLKGWVNDHFGQKLLGLVMVSALSIGNTEMKNTLENLDNEYITQLWRDDRSVIYRFADDIINKTMNVQPTIIIRGGTKINIVVNAHMTLPPLKDYPVTRLYQRP